MTTNSQGWTDRVFNPWLCEQRSVGGTTPAMLTTDIAALGDPAQARVWNAAGEIFALMNGGRRQRVFAGPWCRPLAGDASEPERAAFWQLVRSTPALDWLMLAGEHSATQRFPADWDNGYANVWIGAKVSGPGHVDRRLRSLRALQARRRFVLACPLLEDLGDMDLDGIDWFVVTNRQDRETDPDWIASIKLQCMAFGVSSWFEDEADTPNMPGPAPLMGVHRMRGSV